MPDTTTWILGNGRYEVKRKLGEGGMAFALLAVDRTTGGDVVVKIPKPAMMADSEFARRFRREIRSMQELDHEHIVKINDVGEHEGTPFFVMDLLAGGSLQDRFEPAGNGRSKPMPPESLADWLPQVAAALDYIHQRYVHRDIKPANILFDAYGNAFVSDFGIVKAISGGRDQTNQTVLTQAGMVIGTCTYMAPELSEGQKIDGRADQYALAATVYQALSGRVPFEGATVIEVLKQQILGIIRPLHELAPGLPRALAQIVEKGLSQDPAQRYPTCSAFAQSVLATLTSVKRSQGQPKAVCPVCRTRFALPPNPEGKSVKCTACGAGFRVVQRSAPRKPVQAHETIVNSTSETPPLAIPVARLAEPLIQPIQAASTRKARRTRRLVGYFSVGGVAVLIAGGLGALAWISGQGDHPRRENSQGVLAKEKEVLARKNDVPAAEKKERSKEITNSIGMKLVYIPPGRFTMGSPKSEQDDVRSDADIGWAEQEFQHEVRITKGFYMGVCTVTQEEYEKVMGNNPSWFAGGGIGANAVTGLETRRLPVESVSWNDAKAFCKELGQKEGKTYRLPTEAEWEYACRAGTTTAFHFGATIAPQQANYNPKFRFPKPKGVGMKGFGQAPIFRQRPLMVGSFPANAFGLRDMHGNVRQWCEDYYDRDYYINSPNTDPLNTSNSPRHVMRGGSWISFARHCRSAFRYNLVPDNPGIRGYIIGFRVVLPSP